MRWETMWALTKTDEATFTSHRATVNLEMSTHAARGKDRALADDKAMRRPTAKLPEIVKFLLAAVLVISISLFSSFIAFILLLDFAANCVSRRIFAFLAASCLAAASSRRFRCWFSCRSSSFSVSQDPPEGAEDLAPVLCSRKDAEEQAEKVFSEKLCLRFVDADGGAEAGTGSNCNSCLSDLSGSLISISCLDLDASSTSRDHIDFSIVMPRTSHILGTNANGYRDVGAPSIFTDKAWAGMTNTNQHANQTANQTNPCQIKNHDKRKTKCFKQARCQMLQGVHCLRTSAASMPLRLGRCVLPSTGCFQELRKPDCHRIQSLQTFL